MNKKKNILIIEDQESMRMLLAKYLGADFNVETVKDGMEGMAWLSGGNIPHLILLDMSMPHFDGMDFLNSIRTSGFFSNLPVLIVSAESSSSFQEKCLELGAKGYLTKPFKPQELKSKINNIINQNAQRAAP